MTTPDKLGPSIKYDHPQLNAIVDRMAAHNRGITQLAISLAADPTVGHFLPDRLKEAGGNRDTFDPTSILTDRESAKLQEAEYVMNAIGDMVEAWSKT